MGGGRRIQFLDALRGLSILTVVIHHAFDGWPHLVPYGRAYADIFVIKNGWLSVELFFLISGFVIFMSLEKADSLKDFAIKRWLRLFPAMLVCSVIIFATAPLFPERPHGAPTLASLLPGLTFISPEVYDALGLHVRPLEGVFWSLYVEVAFYAVIGLAYLYLGRLKSIGVLLAMFALAVALNLDNSWLAGLIGAHGAALAVKALDLTGALYYGWFAAGVFGYLYFTTRKAQWAALGLAVGVIAAFTVYLTTASISGFVKHAEGTAVALVLFFFATLAWRPLQNALSIRPLLMLGFASYPLYLIHENIMIALIVKLGHVHAAWVHWINPLAPMLAVIVLGWLIARYLEPAARLRLKAGVDFARSRLSRLSPEPAE
ncbi:acyltransferase family protein [Phenylobacterium sp.]|uniref:acyltransferase family protein n=1 Tax=Phenylobacterium sp. TaxID=1871053 RepID=UPI0035B45C9B